MFNYRPQRSWAKVMFLQASVILLTGGVYLSASWDTSPRSRHPPGSRPPGADTPPEQTSPGADTPWSRHPPEQTPPRADTPLEQTPPGADTPEQTPPSPEQPPRSRHPPREADSSIRSTIGRYASYWNAFLLNAAEAIWCIYLCEISNEILLSL